MPRKKPFSSKQKKKQLQEKRHRKQDQGHYGDDESAESSDGSEAVAVSKSDVAVNKLNQQPLLVSGKGQDANRFRLHFFRESNEEIQRRKRHSRRPYQTLPETALEVSADEIYRPGSVLDIPKRPPWNYSLSKQVLESREEQYFKTYLEEILRQFGPSQLSYFEMNLETWRQLWRVLEISDILLLITDIRHPVLHFSPALYKHVTQDLGKHMIMVLNKVDLAPPSLVMAWKAFLQETFPKIRIVCFTSFPRKMEEKDAGDAIHKKRQRGKFVALGPRELWDACNSIVRGHVDLRSWKEKIDVDLSGVDSPDDGVDYTSTDGAEAGVSSVEASTEDTDYKEHIQFKDGVVTIGCVGFPNVGKSSLMNGLVGKKVVSVSRTPGHTKHLQTIFLTPTVKLCDCPGLVFPSLVEKPLQVLTGMYPIAQVREPCSCVQYLAQRIDVPRLLRVKQEQCEQDGTTWSAFELCDAWALKRGFLTAKAARPDVYRAANNIMRMALEGRLCLCFRPPGYSRRKEFWDTCPETLALASVIAQHSVRPRFKAEEEEVQTSSDEEGDGWSGVTSHVKEEDEEEDEDEEENTLVSNNPFALLDDD